jgi:hypothetical protein
MLWHQTKNEIRNQSNRIDLLIGLWSGVVLANKNSIS